MCCDLNSTCEVTLELELSWTGSLRLQSYRRSTLEVYPMNKMGLTSEVDMPRIVLKVTLSSSCSQNPPVFEPHAATHL